MKYVSDLKELDGKIFMTIADLEAAEAKANEAAAAKQRSANEKKADAKKVEEAIVTRDETWASNARKKEQALLDCIKAVEEARKIYDSCCDEIEKENNKNNDEVIKAVKEFCDKYKQPYHSTISYKDGSTKTYTYSCDKRKELPSLLESINTLFHF